MKKLPQPTKYTPKKYQKLYTMKKLNTFLFCLALMCSTALLAGTVDVRFSNPHVENSKYVVDVQVRAEDIHFELGSATIFFTYNTTQIAHPTFAALNFNESNQCAANSSVAPYKNSFNYLEHSGTIGEGNYSISLMIPNMGCPTVTNEWINVASFSFDIVNPTLQPSLNFNSNYTAFNTVENTGLALNIGTLGSTESSTGINNPSNNTFSVAPTVTTGKVTLNCLLPQSTDLSINIYDMAGKIVQSMNRKQQVGSQQIELDLSRLPNAANLVELSTNGSTQTQKVMVQR